MGFNVRLLEFAGRLQRHSIQYPQPIDDPDVNLLSPWLYHQRSIAKFSAGRKEQGNSRENPESSSEQDSDRDPRKETVQVHDVRRYLANAPQNILNGFVPRIKH